VTLENMQAGYLEDLLDGDLPSGPVRDALMLRVKGNKASLTKLKAMAAMSSSTGKALWQQRYHGAQTGRQTAAGFQVLNLKKSWEDVAPEQLVRDVMYEDPKWLDLVYGDAMEAVSRASRHWIVAEEGHQLYAGDFVSIEAVILACLAGEQWKIDAFRAGVKIYEAMGDKIHGLPPGTVTKATHPLMRQDGKTCLGAGVRVLTSRGWLPIVEVCAGDKLWDGVEWVTHKGLAYQGQREVLSLMGAEMTSDHRVRTGGWHAASTVNSSAVLQSHALAIGSENLPFAASMTKATSRTISGSRPEGSTLQTNDKSGNWNSASPNLKPVYDLMNAGPRRRFTILTDRGPLIVHNCELAFGYGGGLNAWLKFDDSGRHSDERIHEIKDAWRDAHPAVAGTREMQENGRWSARKGGWWQTLEQDAFAAVRCPGETVGCFQVVDEWLSMILSNGKRIWYREPALKVKPPAWHQPATREDCRAGICECQPRAQLTYKAQKNGQWKEVSTYGGKLAENRCQAESREYLIPSMMAAKRAGYPIILSVYDEVVCEVPGGRGSKEEFETLMRDAPGREWAAGWPIKVDAWVGRRYKK
jgi:hypothetical protein